MKGHSLFSNNKVNIIKINKIKNIIKIKFKCSMRMCIITFLLHIFFFSKDDNSHWYFMFWFICWFFKFCWQGLPGKKGEKGDLLDVNVYMMRFRVRENYFVLSCIRFLFVIIEEQKTKSKSTIANSRCNQIHAKYMFTRRSWIWSPRWVTWVSTGSAGFLSQSWNMTVWHYTRCELLYHV